MCCISGSSAISRKFFCDDTPQIGPGNITLHNSPILPTVAFSAKKSRAYFLLLNRIGTFSMTNKIKFDTGHAALMVGRAAMFL
jgi:hypothetical protein